MYLLRNFGTIKRDGDALDIDGALRAYVKSAEIGRVGVGIQRVKTC